MKQSIIDFEKKVFDLMNNGCGDVNCLEMSLVFMGLSVTMAYGIEAPGDGIDGCLKKMLDDLLTLRRDKGEKPCK